MAKWRNFVSQGNYNPGPINNTSLVDILANKRSQFGHPENEK